MEYLFIKTQTCGGTVPLGRGSDFDAIVGEHTGLGTVLNQFLNDNFLKEGAYFRALGSSLGDSRRISLAKGEDPPNAIL